MTMQAVAMFAMVAGASMKTPETSRHFERFVDPGSGAVSYLLKPGSVAPNQQSLYYTQKAMTDDGRFLLFLALPAETEKGVARRQKHLAVLDFLTDEVTVLDDFCASTSSPYLDVETAEVYYIDRTSDDRGIFRRDLRADMRKPVRVCPFPRAIEEMGVAVDSCYTHLTRTSDKRGFFLDCQVRVKDAPEKKDREMLSVLGVVDVATGEFREWYRNRYVVRHGAVNPVRPDVALALEPYWERLEPVHSCAKDGVCRRLLLVRPGSAELIVGQVPPGGKPPVHVVHTEWTHDGSGIYWCSYANGVILHNIDTGRQEVLMKDNVAVHCELSDDGRYLVFDQSAGKRVFRGQSWKVGLYDRETKRTSWIYTCSPELATPERPSKIHPDPHPNFAVRDSYVVCTYTVRPGQVSVLVTPLGQFRK